MMSRRGTKRTLSADAASVLARCEARASSDCVTSIGILRTTGAKRARNVRDARRRIFG
jgi:hypothetical protein